MSEDIRTLAAQLLGDLFLERLDGLALKTSNKQVIDYLAADVAELLHEALIEYCDREIELQIGRADGEPVRLQCFGWESVTVIPFRALGSVDGSNLTANRGSTGFASALRDHFAQGTNERRMLVTITDRGNETQKSAQDARADESLLRRDGLLLRLLQEHGREDDSAARRVVEVLLSVEPESASWLDLVGRVLRWLEATKGQPAVEQGRLLPLLGPFLPDPTPDFADPGAPRVEPADTEQDKRRAGSSRLDDNAALRGYLEDTFRDPLVDPEQVLGQIFEDDPERAAAVARAREEGLDDLPLGTFSGVRKRQRRQKIGFEFAGVAVEGASNWEGLARSGDSLLVVRGAETLRVRVPLSRAFDAKKDFPAIIRWDSEGGKPSRKEVDIANGATEAVYELQSGRPMEVIQLAMLRGRRATTNPIAALDVVVYGSVGDTLVVEQSREVELERQCWIASGTPEFQRFSPGDEWTTNIRGTQTDLDERDDDGTEASADIESWSFEEDSLLLQVGPPQEVTVEGEEQAFELLALAAYRRGTGGSVRDAFQAAADGTGHFMDAVKRLADSGAVWKVDLQGGIQRRVLGSPDSSLEAAVASLLTAPEAARLERTEGTAPDDFRGVMLDGALPGSMLTPLLNARRACFDALVACADPLLPNSRGRQSLAVPLPLVPLHCARAAIEAWIDAWTAAAETLVGEEAERSPALAALLQIDTVRTLRPDGAVDRVSILPTHPWLLGGLLAFQDRMDWSFRSSEKRTLAESEVAELAPKLVLEEWYLEDSQGNALLAADSPPFCPEFVASSARAHRATHDYMARIVANKVGRYLTMHPHLRSSRRSLRIGFVNPGDGHHLLEGLRLWLKSLQVDRLRQLPMQTIPALEVFLFRTGSGDPAALGAALDGFFHLHVSASDEDTLRQALLARLRYRKRDAAQPQSDRDAMHICFVRGLLDGQPGEKLGGPLDEWWDGGFGEGLLTTPLRATRDGQRRGTLATQRGIWLGEGGGRTRSSLRWLLTLLAGQRLGTARPGRALFSHHQLPSVEGLQSTYEHSDWVVHLDRELSLEMFKASSVSDVPTIIEYSDQEVPETPGFDTITVTRQDRPYREQLHEILSMAGLDTRGQDEAARRSADRLLDDINLLSGSWALDFLLGSLADHRYGLRLKGNLGAALTWRWLHRLEQSFGTARVIEANVGRVLPVFISLEELIRVTPAADLKLRDGLAYRFSNEYEDDDEDSKKARAWCDDLLVLYVTPTERGKPSTIFGRVIEVKLGTSAFGAKEKAIRQVKGTRQLLADHLAGGSERVDAPFRDKQLSLLLKAQLEQSVAMGALRQTDLEDFNIAGLSSNLATGNYKVEYTLGVDGQHVAGDVFLLSTAPQHKWVSVGTEDGVRIIKVGADLVEWLAFQRDDAPTLSTAPDNTMPDLGTYSGISPLAESKPRTVRQKPKQASRPINQPEVAAAPPARASEEPPSPGVRAPSPAFGESRDGPGATPANPLPREGTWIGTEAPDLVDSASDSWAAPPAPEMSLKEASKLLVKEAPYADEVVLEVVQRLEKGLKALGVDLESSLSIREVDRGPRLLRIYARLAASQSIAGVRKVTEDLARNVGTSSSDLHVANVTSRRSVGIDLPVPGLTYAIDFDELAAHPSFQAARAELALGFCAGIDVTGRPLWADLAKMPHMLVAGTTGSGKTVFLRNVILTLMLQHPPRELQVRLSSTKPMDFRVFTTAPHTGGTDLARNAAETKEMIDELVVEMERRMRLLDEAMCDDIGEYNEENPDKVLPRYVVVLDEFAATVGSFDDKADRQSFEGSVQRIAQEARAAGLHLVLCMQRPDAKVVTGNIKANVLHRFALKLPQLHDSRVILDEPGAETLLGKGDMLYKDANSQLHRLQVPNLEKRPLKRMLKDLSGPPVHKLVAPDEIKECPKCGESGAVSEMFGTRRMRRELADGSTVLEERAQSYCRECRKP